MSPCEAWRPEMDVRNGFVGSIGDTPLIKLRAASERTGCTILGKAEFLTPGGSVTDRAALAIIEDAERNGRVGQIGRASCRERGGQYVLILGGAVSLKNKKKEK